MTLSPLAGVRIVSIGLNVPAPVAAHRLKQLGAHVTKVEPPGGDPLAKFAGDWYLELSSGQDVLRLDLKNSEGLASFEALLELADVLLTSQRLSALARLGFGQGRLNRTHPRLLHVAIVGERGAESDEAGHDLTYLARAGLLRPPELPRTLAVDLAGAERAVGAVLALLMERDRGGTARYAEVALAELARELAAPLDHGLTSEGGVLGGGLPFYRIYRARNGWVALAALEERFQIALRRSFAGRNVTHEELEAFFRDRDADDWEDWGKSHDVPLKALR